MDVNTITTFINNVGFPIAISIALFYQMFKTQATYNKTLQEFKSIIENNTVSVTQMNKVVEELENIVREIKIDRMIRKEDDNQ